MTFKSGDLKTHRCENSVGAFYRFNIVGNNKNVQKVCLFDHLRVDTGENVRHTSENTTADKMVSCSAFSTE